MARYLSTVSDDHEIRSAHFAVKLLCLREHSLELSNISNKSIHLLSVDEIDDLLSAVLC